MREFSEQSPSAAELPQWIDRLVDGELNDAQQRQLLVALEAEPDAWRRCALAFVEAQSLGQELRALSRESALSTLPRPAVSNRPNGTNGKLRTFLLAASLLLAFVMGAGARDWWTGQPLPRQIADHPSKPLVNEQVVANAAPTTHRADESISATSWQALKVTLPSADGHGGQTVEVPLVPGDEQKLQSLLVSRPAMLSDVARETLESTGHEIEEHRAFYPVKLDDGRQAVLPMDFVEVRYTGGWQ